MAFAVLHSTMGGKRYDFWWYVGRAELVAAYVVMLYGFLQEGYALLGRERQRAEERQQMLGQLREQKKGLQAQAEEIQSQYEKLRLANEELVAKESRLSESERRFSLIFEKAPFAATLSMLPDGVLVDVNEAWVNTFGYSKEEAVGKTTLDLGINPDTDGRARIIAGLQDRGSARDQGLPLHTRSGEVRVFSTNVDLVEMDGRAYALNVTQDVTERKKAEAEREQLLQAEQEARKIAEAALSARDEFLSVAAHELKTPITGLVGFAQTLLRQLVKYGDLDPQRLRRALQVIDGQAQKTSRLVAQLLDISRFDQGQLRLVREQADLVHIARDAVEAAQITATGRAIVLEAPAQAQALVDPTRIEQVVSHLIDNAIRFSPHGGAIVVTVVPLDDRVELSVRDHGIGIPPEHREQLFDRFNRAHSSEYRSGLGLGLYISKQIVSLHGGQINVEAPQDGGTRFTVVLPRSS